MKKPEATTLNDFLKLGETALSILLGAAKDIKSHAPATRDSFARKMDLVTREEFDAAFHMIKKARKMQDELQDRLTLIEAKMNLSSPQKRSTKKQIREKK